jgi:hypothetical protein
MFPRLREQIGTALDLFVEFSTLGEYRLAVEPLGGAGAPADASCQAPQLGGVGAEALRAAVRRTVAGGPTGQMPVATPAARRRLQASRRQPHASLAPRAGRVAAAPRSRVRQGAPKVPEQLCLAV